ncbi:hypothetical protein [Paenibacillus sp. sgz302251]|uniref:hypothetical protein n=1 Tax=Paenibacillus sp. sgz302251 TaxID=3414493 RepID=UPI003C79F64C
MRRFGIHKLLLFAIVAAVLLSPAQAFAQAPYTGYIWNNQGDARSINGYLYYDSIDGYDMASGPFNAPEDLFIDQNDHLYVVDSGNNRIVKMDNEKKVLRTIGDESGPGQLNGPKGIYVKKDGTIYVSDTLNRRIAIFSAEGKFLQELKAPSSPLLGKSFIYSPSKLTVDKRNYLLIASDGGSEGLLQIDAKGEFKGFYGANHVGFSWQRLFIKTFATSEQRQQLARVRPTEFSNLHQDQEGFMYTTTLGVQTNQIKRLSAVGVDTLNSSPKEYGDLFTAGSVFEVPAFSDLTVDNKGVITAIDQANGKAFQYDKLRNLLFVFGGLGEQNGLFKTPVAIDQTSDGTIYILDKAMNRISLFRTTPFADLVHQASALYVDGRYAEAMEPWNKVLELNSNYDLAYNAIGKALFKAEKYKEAMMYFRLGRSQYDYSLALREHRKEYMRQHFTIIVVCLIAIYLLLKFGVRLVRSKWKQSRAVPYESVTKNGGRA